MASNLVTMRSAQEKDLSGVQAILAYYALNTVITFAITPSPYEEVHQKWVNNQEDGLPYIVAVDNEDSVVGFCLASSYDRTRGGYRHTVRLSLFCHPDYTAKCIGSRLLTKLIDVLKSPQEYPEYFARQRGEDERVRVVNACMTLDQTRWKNGYGLKEFYERHGFEEVGHFKKVGHKFDRW
jgi:phosphinothricin acetyltransferase